MTASAGNRYYFCKIELDKSLNGKKFYKSIDDHSFFFNRISAFQQITPFFKMDRGNPLCYILMVKYLKNREYDDEMPCGG
jgi:hypothetical protein